MKNPTAHSIDINTNVVKYIAKYIPSFVGNATEVHC